MRAGLEAGAETFDLQAYIFCRTGTWCSHPSEQSLRDAWYVQAAERNLEYEGAGISFRPKPPVIIQDDRYPGMRGPTEQLALNGEENDVLEAELVNLYGATNTQEITVLLAPNLTTCWKGIPCPGDGNDDDPCPSNPNTPFDAGNDSIPDVCDVCPYVWDPDQVDTDQDGFGDAWSVAVH